MTTIEVCTDLGLMLRAVLASTVIAAVAVAAAPPAAASGPTLGEPCSDYDKLANDTNTGEQLYCDPHLQKWWNQIGPIIDVQTIGTSCAGYQPWQKVRSPDDYLIWCEPTAGFISYGCGGPLWQQFLQSHPQYGGDDPRCSGVPPGGSILPAPPGSIWKKYAP